MITAPPPPIFKFGEVYIPEDATIFSLKESGAYDFESRTVREHLASQQIFMHVRGRRNLYIAGFQEEVLSYDVKRVLKEMMDILAWPEDLLAAGARYMSFQRQSPVVCLRPLIVGGTERFLCLDGGDDSRDLRLLMEPREWDAGCQFLLADYS